MFPSPIPPSTHTRRPIRTPVQPLHIDGTTLEGGGQILRLAVGLSVLTRSPIHITDIRGKRYGGGGLKAQHLTGVEWLGRRAEARMRGVEMGSREIGLEYGDLEDVGIETEIEGVEIEIEAVGSALGRMEVGGKGSGDDVDVGEHEEVEEEDGRFERGGKRGQGAGAGKRRSGKGKERKSKAKLEIEKRVRDKRAGKKASRDEHASNTQERAANVWEIKQQTPGSVNLVLQAVLPYILFSHLPSSTTSTSNSATGGSPHPVTLRITGGTNVSNSPSYDYVEQVLVPMLDKIGIKVKPRLVRRGWSSAGRDQGNVLGEVEYAITPLKEPLRGFQLVERGTVMSVKATIIAPAESEVKMREILEETLDRYYAPIFSGQTEAPGQEQEPQIDIIFEPSGHKKRFYLLLVATTSTGMRLGRDWLYDGGFKHSTVEDTVPKRVVHKVVMDFVTGLQSGGCVDEYLRDQVVVFQALAEGRSEVFGGQEGEGRGKLKEGSLHMQTAQWVVGRMLGVEFDGGGGCRGVGYVPGMGKGARE